MPAPTLDYAAGRPRRHRVAFGLTVGSLTLTAVGLLIFPCSVLNAPNIGLNLLLFIAVIPIGFVALLLALTAMILRRGVLTAIALLLAAVTLSLPVVFAIWGMTPKSGYGP